MRASSRFAILAAVSVLLASLAACYYEKVSVQTTSFEPYSYRGQVPWETIAYLKEKYPPDYWKASGSKLHIAVGPIFLKREAYVVIKDKGEPEDLQSGRYGGAEGEIVLQNQNLKFYYVNKLSDEARSRIMTRLSDYSWVVLHMLEDHLLQQIVHGQYELSDMDIGYLINGTVSRFDVAPNGNVTIYLRLIDTLNSTIVCASSGEGASLTSATDKALDGLVGKIAKFFADTG